MGKRESYNVKAGAGVFSSSFFPLRSFSVLPFSSVQLIALYLQRGREAGTMRSPLGNLR
jgi:hypothetical protein